MAGGTATLYGAVWSIVDAWWRSGCQPLPEADTGLQVMARCHTQQWHPIRDRTKRAIAEIMPDLERAYLKAKRRHTSLVQQAEHMTDVRMRRAAERRLQRDAGQVRIATHPLPGPIQPVRGQPFDSPGIDMKGRAQALERGRSDAPTGPVFRDT